MRGFPLTPAELEEAARALAELRGVDPDGPVIASQVSNSSVWQMLAREITRVIEVSQVLQPIMDRWEEEEMKRLTTHSDFPGIPEDNHN